MTTSSHDPVTARTVQDCLDDAHAEAAELGVGVGQLLWSSPFRLPLDMPRDERQAERNRWHLALLEWGEEMEREMRSHRSDLFDLHYDLREALNAGASRDALVSLLGDYGIHADEED